MRKLRFVVAAVAAVLLGGTSVFAAAITNDGNWNDWFDASNPSNAALLGQARWDPNQITPFAGIGTYKDPYVGNNPNFPGVGGQPYDAEQIFYYAENDILHIGLITGFSPGGEVNTGASAPGTYVPNYFLAGDLFLNFGNIGSAYDLAVGLSNHASFDRSGRVWGAENGPLSIDDDTIGVYYQGNPDHSIADPFWVDEDVAESAYVTADVSYRNYTADYGVQRWFYEISISGLGAELGANILAHGLAYHWTMECGNDIIRNHDTGFTPPLTPVPVPAAAPMILLGMGGIAFMRRVRKPKA